MNKEIIKNSEIFKEIREQESSSTISYSQEKIGRENQNTLSELIKDINEEYLQVLLNEAIEYINYMELTVKKLLNGEELGIHTFELFDPYKKYKYVESGVEEKYTTCLDKSGVVKTVDWEGLNKHPWYDYYTEASIKKVYNSFCKYFKEEYEKKITKK